MTRERMRASALFAIPPELKPYITYSLGAHVALALLAAHFLLGASAQSTQVYTIDFVGPSTTIISQLGPASPASGAAAPSNPKAASEEQPDEFSTRKHHGKFVLPRPSLLNGYQAEKEETPPADAEQAATPGPAVPAAGVPGTAGAPGDASISADMPNFPYPWYIAQVRAALWAQWSQRMQGLHGECIVVFTLLPDGRVTDLRTEETSGDSAFDLAALGSVQDGGPYPPLPKGFAEPFLKIHVTLKSSS